MVDGQEIIRDDLIHPTEVDNWVAQEECYPGKLLNLTLDDDGAIL
jgi:hypothetical protein